VQKSNPENIVWITEWLAIQGIILFSPILYIYTHIYFTRFPWESDLHFNFSISIIMFIMLVTSKKIAVT
jgi:hypothetical protein